MQDIPRGRRAPVLQNGSEFWRSSTRPDRHPLGNLIYLGTGLHSVNGQEPEPALIDPRLTVDSRVKDCRGGGQGWEPSYARCSPQMRAAYLLWLNTGRSDPRAPVSHVILYFYGLERRAVHDARREPAAQAELPAIRNEVGRLRRLYGAHERLKERSTALLEYLAAEGLPERSYLQAPTPRDGALTYVEQMMLGQCAQDAAPLPAAWAFRFVQGGLGLWPRGLEASRQQALWECFEQVYRQRCGPGLVVPVTPRQLELRYWPASPTFDGVLKHITVETGLPNLLEEPQWCGPLLAVVKEVQARTSEPSHVPVLGTGEPASRAPAGESPDPGAGSLLARPLHEWPEEPRTFLGDLRGRVRQGTYTVMRLTDFAPVFPELDRLTPQDLQRLCEALARTGVGMMPDPRFGEPPARPVRAVLFIDDPATASSSVSEAYRDALLRLELPAAAMAGERAYLRAHEPQMSGALKLEPQLTTSERRRLMARLQLMLHEPPLLWGLKSGLGALTPAQRLSMAEHLVNVVRPHTASGPFPAAVQQALETCRELLGDVSGPAIAGVLGSPTPRAVDVLRPAPARGGYRIPAPTPSPPPRTPQVSLDPAKIAALKQEEARLAEIFEPVFTEGSDTLPVPSRAEPETSPDSSCLLGLDPGASAFLRMLLGRQEWTRAELTERATRAHLPLNGVLERINEASFEHLDMPLFEDADPLILLPEAVAAISASPSRP